MEPSKLSSVARRLFESIEFDQDEKLISEIRKHPFGLFVVYFTGMVVTASLFIIFIILPSFVLNNDAVSESVNTSNLNTILAIIGGILTLLSLVVTAIGAYLYQSNVVLVTSEKIAQVLYRSIFDRKISQLSIGDVQDVTVTKKGILANLFNYGTLVIETAGEQQNYTFTFTPDPYENAKKIVGAHEENLKRFGN